MSEQDFSLEEGAPLPAKLRNFYKFTYIQYGTGEGGAPKYCNSKDGKTIKRWVSAGRHASPVDLPPLDEPARMAAWYRRRYPSEIVPALLREFENGAPPPPPPTQTPPSEEPKSEVKEPSKERAPEKMMAIDFIGIDPDADAAVRRAAVIEEANGRRVEEASKLGDADAYRRWMPVWKDSANLLRQLQKEDREARKSSGALLDRGQVIAEISQLLEALRIMGETMPAKILAELSKTECKRTRRVLRLIEGPIRAAIVKARAAETAIFQQMETLQTPEQLRTALDQAA